MQRFLKIVFWISIGLPCFWILASILSNFIPLEFSDNQSESIYEGIRFYGFPLAIMLTLTGTIKSKDSWVEIAAKVFVTICVSAFTIVVMVLTLFAGMCNWATTKVFFENKQNATVKIVQRSYGCGATDSAPAILEVFEVTEITPYLIWVTPIDTNQIDKNEWRRMENSEQ